MTAPRRRLIVKELREQFHVSQRRASRCWTWPAPASATRPSFAMNRVETFGREVWAGIKIGEDKESEACTVLAVVIRRATWHPRFPFCPGRKFEASHSSSADTAGLNCPQTPSNSNSSHRGVEPPALLSIAKPVSAQPLPTVPRLDFANGCCFHPVSSRTVFVRSFALLSPCRCLCPETACVHREGPCSTERLGCPPIAAIRWLVQPKLFNPLIEASSPSPVISAFRCDRLSSRTFLFPVRLFSGGRRLAFLRRRGLVDDGGQQIRRRYPSRMGRPQARSSRQS